MYENYIYANRRRNSWKRTWGYQFPTPFSTKIPNPKVKEIIVDGKEFIELTEKNSEEKLKQGADLSVPVFDMVEAAILVSV